MRIFRILLIVLVIGLLAWWVWQRQHPSALEVSMTPVTEGEVESTVANTRAGTIKACHRAQMSPSSSGQISELPFAKGQQVQAGDVLLRLWNQDLQANVEASSKAVNAATEQRDAACLQADVNRRTAERSNRLRASNAISREEQDKTQAAADVAQASCKAANAQITVTQAQLKAAQAQLERTVLIAPFAGVIADINGELNEFVTPSPPGIQTLPVIDLIEPGCFLASAPIDEVDAPKVKLGLPARITLDAFRGRQFAGKVTRIGSYVLELEKQARTVEVDLAFTNTADLQDLLVGYSADVDIILDSRAHVLRIPTEALFDTSYVYVLNPESKLEKRQIQTGLSNWTFTEVRSGLAKGEQVVTTPGIEGVMAGILARPKPATDEQTTATHQGSHS